MSMDQSQPSKRARADVTSVNFEANLFTQLGQLEKEGKMTNLKVGAPCISFLRDITKILQQSALKRLVRSEINTIIDVAYTCYQWWHQRNDLRGKWGWNVSSHSTIEPCEKSCISCLKHLKMFLYYVRGMFGFSGPFLPPPPIISVISSIVPVHGLQTVPKILSP